METELKFQVPAAQRDAVRRAVATASAVTTRLQAIYADTPGRDLAAAKLAWRLRKEGRVWVQALKGPGDGLAQRLEHEVRLPAQRGEPVFDAGRHAGSAAGERLAEVLAQVRLGAAGARGGGLGDAGEPVEPVYRTDIRRTHRRIRSGGALIEIAHDRGHLIAGEAVAEVDEVEFELIQGPRTALVELAQRWVQRHGLWWDCRTKSERGHRLALGQHEVSAPKAGRLRWAPPIDAAVLFERALLACLAHALPNAAELAEPAELAQLDTGPPARAAAAAHVHQLRVALRRLRSVLRELAPFGADAASARALEQSWRSPFAALGTTRDLQVQRNSLWPQLQAAGGPPLEWPQAAPAAAPADVVTAREFNRAALATLALAWHSPQPADPGVPAAAAASAAPSAASSAVSSSAPHAPLETQARALLRRLWRRTQSDTKGFATAPVEQQHRLRKRLKRLRYVLDFLGPLYPRKALRAFQAELANALDALGALNDVQTAAAACRERARQEAQGAQGAQAKPEPQPSGAWFALGWLAAREVQCLRACRRALKRLHGTPRPWRR